MPFTAPSGRKVVIGGNPVIEELTVEGTGIKPSLLCKKGTAATQVVVVAAATDKPSGWVGWDGEGAHPGASPADRTTAYTAGKKCPVAYGPGTIIYGRLASGQNVTKDTPLIPAADGELQAASTMANTETASTAHVTATPTGSFPAGGMIVALAKENKDASGGAANIIVESLI
jgi:hypothetical protein